MRSDDRGLILDMIAEAAGFVAGRVRADLDSDRMLFHAVVRAIEVIGEAASRVSGEMRATTPQVPWRTMVAMRNRLIHGYARVDPDVVWATVTSDIPTVLPLLRALASTSDEGGGRTPSA